MSDGRCPIFSPQFSLRLGLGFAIAVCQFAGTVKAQQQREPNPISIAGTVMSDSGNKRIAGAVIQLCDLEGRMIAEHHTYSLGEFSFRGLSPGTYTFRVSAEGYESTEFQPGYRIVSDQSFTLYMKALRPDSSEPSTLSSVSAHELSMPSAARELYFSGMKKLYSDKNAQGGLEDFQKSLRKAPSYYEAQFQAGMAYLSLGKGQDAEASFRRAIEMSGDKYSEANLALGVLFFDRGDLEAAKTQLHRALELNPSAWMACYKLGDIAYREKNLTDAESWTGKAKLIEANMPMVYELLAQIHVQQKKYASAVQDLDAYIKLEPDSAKATQAKELREKLQQLIEQQ